MNYEEFLRAFEDGRKDHYKRKGPDVTIHEYQGMTPQEAENRLREAVATQADVLGKVSRNDSGKLWLHRLMCSEK